MNSTLSTRVLRRLALAGGVALAVLAFVLPTPAVSDDVVPGSVPIPPEVTRFESPDAAAKAFVEAVRAGERAKFVQMLGQAAIDLITTGDEGADQEARETFLLRANDAVAIEMIDEANAEILIGKDRWPFAIPLVKDEKGWAFDAAEGALEILRRRVGENEILTVATLREYVRAQVEYARVDRDADEVREFAQRVVSSEGQKDGLWWPSTGEGDESPLGEFAAAAGDYVQGTRPPGTWHGYYYRILTKQGDKVPGGRYDYVINGNMIAGFAMIAFPAEYRSTGVMTFVVSHSGKVYEKDLGADTEKLASAIVEYNPDETWKLVVGDGSEE